MEFKNMLFRESNTKKKILLIANITNVALIAILLMVATGINNITNETLSDNDLTQMLTILTSIISVSVIVIIFFQWMMMMIFKSLYNNRKDTNINLRLIGLTSKELRNLYIKEILFLQKIALPIGIIIAFISWSFISVFFDHQTVPVLNAISILGAIFLHISISLGTTYIILSKYVKQNVIEVLRGTDENIYTFKINNAVIIKIAIAFLISLILFIINRNAEKNAVYYLIQLAYVIPILLVFDVAMFLLSKINIMITKKYQYTKIMLSELIGSNYFKRDKVIFFMIILSTTLFIGLQMMFVNTRIVAAERVMSNINYEVALIFQNFQENSFIESDSVLLGVRLIAKLENGSDVNVYGIDGRYLNNFENIVLDNSLSDLTNDELLSYLDDDTWNGIIFPQNFISRHDIGNTITVSYYGTEIEFTIVGGYFINNFSQLTTFASKGYINYILGKSGYFNVAYLLEESEKNTILSNFNSDVNVLSREEIQRNSAEHAVQGTSLIELTSILIVTVSIIILVNLIAMNSKQNERDMVKLRALGLSKFSVLKIYFIYVTSLISKAFLLGFVSATIFGKIGSYIILDRHYYANGFRILWIESFLLYMILLIVAIISICLFSLNIIKNKHVELLRDFH